MFQTKSYILAAAIVIASTSFVHADERYNPINDQMVKEECGACHLAFQPQMLPKRSWEKIMTGLSDHFGEDASLDETSAKHIKTYLVDNAADGGWLNGKFLRGVKDNMTPLRITKMPYWVREHNEEVPNKVWSFPKVKSKANCKACHSRAERGNYDDD